MHNALINDKLVLRKKYLDSFHFACNPDPLGVIDGRHYYIFRLQDCVPNPAGVVLVDEVTGIPLADANLKLIPTLAYIDKVNQETIDKMEYSEKTGTTADEEKYFVLDNNELTFKGDVNDGKRQACNWSKKSQGRERMCAIIDNLIEIPRGTNIVPQHAYFL